MFFQERKKKIVPTLPKIFRPFTRNTLSFLFGLNGTKVGSFQGKAFSYKNNCFFTVEKLKFCIFNIFMGGSFQDQS